MKEVVRFFWERWKRGVQMGSKWERDAIEWSDAYKNTLSKSKQKEFDKVWESYTQELIDYHNANPKKQKGMNPMRLPL